ALAVSARPVGPELHHPLAEAAGGGPEAAGTEAGESLMRPVLAAGRETTTDRDGVDPLRPGARDAPGLDPGAWRIQGSPRRRAGPAGGDAPGSLPRRPRRGGPRGGGMDAPAVEAGRPAG